MRCQHDVGGEDPYCPEIDSAAGDGNLRRLQRLHENGCPWDDWACSEAAEHGHLECLKYLHENGCPWDADTCTRAAEHGQLECLKYLHENGYPWDARTCIRAAEQGHLECLKYLHENGCPWNAYTCTYAAAYGQLECLKYAYEHGCPCDEEIMLRLEFKTAINILQELHEVIPNETCEIANQNLQALYSCDIVRDAELGEIREITIANMAHRRLLVFKTMTALDEVRETIPNGLYVRMSACLKRIYDFVVYD